VNSLPGLETQKILKEAGCLNARLENTVETRDSNNERENTGGGYGQVF
jgi:hypothetical protein